MAKNLETIEIIKIEKVGKLYQVFPSIGDTIKVTMDQIVEFRIIKNTCFTFAEWEKIKNSLDLSLIVDQAMHYIDYKLRTEKEVSLYLKNKGIALDIIQNVIDKLKKLSYIDDDRYAKIYVEENIKNKMGPGVIRYNLVMKGIDDAVFNQYLQNYDTETMYQNALDMANITLKKIVGYPINKQKEAVYSRLQRMGYDSSIVSRVMANTIYSELDNDLLEKEYQKLVDKGLDKNKIITKLLAKGYSYSDVINIINNHNSNNK